MYTNVELSIKVGDLFLIKSKRNMAIIFLLDTNEVKFYLLDHYCVYYSVEKYLCYTFPK